MAKTQSQRLTELENQLAAQQTVIATLQQELADIKGAQRILAAGIRDLSAPSPTLIAQVNRSRQ